MLNWAAKQARLPLRWPRVLLALALPVVAVALRFALADYMPRSTYGPLYVAVFVSAWIGGPWLGLAATALGTLLVVWLVMEPQLTLAMQVSDIVPTIIFVATGASFAWFQVGYRDMLRRADEAEARRLNDAGWALAVDAGALGLWQWDLCRREMTVSPRYRRMLGHADDTDVVTPESEFFSNVHPEDLARVRATIRSHLAGHSPTYTCEFRLRHRDGHHVWVESRGLVVRRGSEGEAELMLGSHVDVTDRHRQQEALSRAHDMQSMALQAGELGAWDLSLPDRVLTTTDQCRRLYGLPIEREATLGEVLAAIHAEDRPRVEAAIERAIQTGEVVAEDFRIRWRDDSLRWLQWTGRVIFEGDRPTRIAGLLRASRDSDMLLLAEGIQQMVWIADGPNLIYFNRSWLEFCGVTMDSQLGSGWLESLHPEDREPLRQLAIDAADPAMTSFEHQYRLRRHDGEYRWCISRARKLSLHPASRALWYGTTVDVHDLHDALDKARSADRAKAAFLATTSHELRTPLNSIIGFTTLLLAGEMGPLQEGQRRPLEIVQRSSQQLLRLVQDVLDFTTIEAGNLKLSVRSTPVAALLSEIREQLMPRASARGLDLPVIECDEGLRALADPVRLGQAVRNLVANGVNYTDRGYVRISATADGNFARIDVRDSGIGIPPGEMHKLFCAFDPIQRGEHKNREGTGLGLVITRRVVESMGGEVGCTSEMGVGSHFWIKVPLAV